MNKLHLLVPFVFMVGSALAHDEDDGVWPMFRHDHRRSGLSDYAGPSSGDLKWRYSMCDMGASGPVLAEDGTVFAGSVDDHLHAIHGESGAISWRYDTKSDILNSAPAVDIGGGDIGDGTVCECWN
jgi:hypothetical protein